MEKLNRLFNSIAWTFSIGVIAIVGLFVAIYKYSPYAVAIITDNLMVPREMASLLITFAVLFFISIVLFLMKKGLTGR